MSITSRMFVKKAAMYYAAKFESKRANQNDRVLVCKSGYVFDIISGRRQAKRAIEVKGSSRGTPPAFPIYITVRERNKLLGRAPINSKKYFVYLVYNIRINERPMLAVLNSIFLKKHMKKRRDNTIHILRVAQGMVENRIKPQPLPKLTFKKKKIICDFYKRYQKRCREKDEDGLWIRS